MFICECALLCRRPWQNVECIQLVATPTWDVVTTYHVSLLLYLLNFGCIYSWVHAVYSTVWEIQACIVFRVISCVSGCGKLGAIYVIVQGLVVDRIIFYRLPRVSYARTLGSVSPLRCLASWRCLLNNSDKKGKLSGCGGRLCFPLLDFIPICWLHSTFCQPLIMSCACSKCYMLSTIYKCLIDYWGKCSHCLTSSTEKSQLSSHLAGTNKGHI